MGANNSETFLASQSLIKSLFMKGLYAIHNSVTNLFLFSFYEMSIKALVISILFNSKKQPKDFFFLKTKNLSIRKISRKNMK